MQVIKKLLPLSCLLLLSITPSANANGVFAVDCERTERKPLDPIVMPGMPGMSHMHDFFGPSRVDDSAKPIELTKGSSSCRLSQDHSAYWMPTMYDRYRLVDGQYLQAYYRFGGGESVMPKGLVMIAGDASRTKTNPQWSSWSCWPGGKYGLTLPPPCMQKDHWLLSEVDFPSCWDGVHLDSSNHKSHVTYPAGTRCPKTHPVRIPQLVLFRNYVADPVWNGFSRNIFLASGPAGSLHADFVSGWDRADFQALMKRCQNKDCGHISSAAATRARVASPSLKAHVN